MKDVEVQEERMRISGQVQRGRLQTTRGCVVRGQSGVRWVPGVDAVVQIEEAAVTDL